MRGNNPTNSTVYGTTQKKMERTCWQDSNKDLKIKVKKMFWIIAETMLEFCFVISVAGLSASLTMEMVMKSITGVTTQRCMLDSVHFLWYI
jgi:hypothetical protein